MIFENVFWFYMDDIINMRMKSIWCVNRVIADGQFIKFEGLRI